MKRFTTIALLLLIMLACPVLQAQVIGMRVPDSTVVAGNNIDIPIYADNTLTGKNVLSYVLQLSFSQTYFQVVSVITAGTISAPYGSPAVNTSVPGQITIAGAGTNPLSGSGKFIYIRFKALQPGGLYIIFTGAQNNYFNEGLPAMSFHNGYMNISAPPSISVSPNSGLITKGETQQFSVSGGAAPYQWFVTNPSVAAISASGLLTGTLAGFTKVVAVDNNGLRDTTNAQVEVRAMRLSISTTLSQWQGLDIDVPVNTTDLSGLNIYSGSFSLGFNQNILTPVGVIQAGTLLASYPAPLVNINNPGTLALDFAGATPLSGSGILLYVRFHVSSLNTGASSITFSNGLFNESFIPNYTDGYFSTINLPVLSITPNSGTMVAGQTKQFTLNGGGAPPIVWSTSNPLVATISQTGLMTTFKGGNVTVTATDVHGASATTANWLVYDTQVIMPDTNTCPAAGEFYYPIFITALPSGESVSSVQATVTYNSAYLAFQALETTGTQTQGWTFVTNPTTGQVIFAGSGATAFNTAGIIIKMRFLLKPAFILGSQPFLQLNAVTLNEGIPNPLVDLSGYISGVNPNLPVGVTVAASVNPVYSGNPVTFTATPKNGGPGPLFQWKVNGIAITGATNQTYSYVPLNNDAVTCVLTSNAACITTNPVTSGPLVMTVSTVPVNLAVVADIPGGQTKCYSATSTITIAGAGNTFTVQNGGYATMIAGQNILYLPGTKVYAGGYMHGYIAPGGPYCVFPPFAPVAAGTEETFKEVAQPLFKVYPNPTSGDFTLVLGQAGTSGQSNIEIFGMQGEKIISATLKDEMKHVFSLSAKPAGIYFIRVISGNMAETRKIIRQ
ncbi:MAG: Ig-like domain-containing protein [Bacteroidetes bacterium]|nr:Ig-like domain-containing protein [Bacteroidota bacterium]